MSLGKGRGCYVNEGAKISSRTPACEDTNNFKCEIAWARGHIRSTAMGRTLQSSVKSMTLMSGMMLLLTAKNKILTLWLGDELKF